MRISIIIRTFNNEDIIKRTLTMIQKQENFDYELIAVDSGSTDSTLSILKEHNVNIFNYPFKEYHPSLALRYGIEKSSGDILVFNNSDCIPSNPFWLQNLVLPILHNDSDVSFARQSPMKDAWPLVRLDHANCFSDKAKLWFPFSMASCAVRKSVFDKVDFNLKMYFSEDIEWIKRVKEANFRVKYAPKARVFHSHNYDTKEVLNRFYNEGYANYQIYPSKKKISVFVRQSISLIKQIAIDMAFLIKRRKYAYLLTSFKYRLIQRVSYLNGELLGRDYYKRV